MKKRLPYHHIIKYLNHKNALVITGMRQVGKTTLMKHIYDKITDKSKLWFDFDNPLDQKVFEDDDYHTVYHRLHSLAGGEDRFVVFIDEIQNYPEITKVIKFLIDHYRVKFIVTGSSSYYLKNLFPESLSGRKFLYHLQPMSFQEYLYFHDIISLKEALSHSLERALFEHGEFVLKKRSQAYEQFMMFGGFPEVVLTKDDKTKTEVLKNIITSFFEKDIHVLSDLKDIRELRDLILLLVPRVGSTLQITRLSSELGINRMKIYDMLELLQATFFIHLLPKFSRSIDKSIASGRKVYFSDTGLLRAIGSVNEAQLFENTVINQLSHLGEVSFYRERETSEIDAILDKQFAFEIKTTGTQKDTRKVKKLSDKLKLKKSYVVSYNYRDIPGIVYPHFF